MHVYQIDWVCFRINRNIDRNDGHITGLIKWSSSQKKTKIKPRDHFYDCLCHKRVVFNFSIKIALNQSSPLRLTFKHNFKSSWMIFDCNICLLLAVNYYLSVFFFSNSECHSKYFPFNSINDQQDMLSIMHEKIILLENNQWVIITQFHKFKGAAYVFLFAAIHWWIVISLFIYQFKYITNNLKSTSYTHQWILYGNVYALACHQICHLYIRFPLSLFFSLTLTYTWTKYFFFTRNLNRYSF